MKDCTISNNWNRPTMSKQISYTMVYLKIILT